MLLTQNHSVNRILESNDLRKQLKHLKVKSLVQAGFVSAAVFGGLCYGFDIAAFADAQRMLFSGLLFSVVFKKSYDLLASRKHIRALSSGAEGEARVAKDLSSLPGNFRIYNHFLIPNPRSATGYTEVDFLVVGKNGIHVLEVKNNQGKISVTESDDQWRVLSGGRKALMRNPVKQAKLQRDTLRKYLEAHGFECQVSASVLMSNPACKLKTLEPVSLPVLKMKSANLKKHVRRLDKAFKGGQGVSGHLVERLNAIHKEGLNADLQRNIRQNRR